MLRDLNKRGQKSIILQPIIALKLAVYQATREQGLTHASLGKLMGVDGWQVRRILDLDHDTTLPNLDLALESLGKRMVVDIRDVAC